MLTEREKEVLIFIKNFKEKNNKVPSARQITNSMGFKSSRSAQNYITALKAKGKLTDRDPEPSAYMIAEEAHQIKFSNTSIPFLGKIAAGYPLESYLDGVRTIEFSSRFFGESNQDSIFALEIVGNSMSGDAICEGDIAIIKRQQQGFHKEDILAVHIRQDEYTLKRVVFKDGLVRLEPSNPRYPTLEVPPDQVQIIGKFVGLLRRS
jgi:repressor LexA